jgi:5-methyltetrahydrofolate--homocysteine methyltransferase
VRKEFWGYAAGETLDNDALIDEQYAASARPGYPACPNTARRHAVPPARRENATPACSLTESFAMYPAAAVSGYYFSHPQSQYFVVGRVSKEQVEDYARRKGVSLAQAERWLASNLDYDPE